MTETSGIIFVLKILSLQNMSSTSSNLVLAKASFTDILSQFNSEDRRIFLDWVSKEIENKSTLEVAQNSEMEYRKTTDSRNILTRISSFIKERCVVDASQQGTTLNGSVWNSEKLYYPATFSVGGDSDKGLSTTNTIHLDSFLYDEAEEDEMLERGEISRTFCRGIS